MNINNFGLLNSLYSIINNGAEDNDYAVASFILHHLEDLKELTVNQITQESYTTSSAVRRFCQRVGYANFSAFKESVSRIIFPSNLMYRDFLPIADYRHVRSREISELLAEINRLFSDAIIQEITKKIRQANKVVLVSANNTSGDLVRFQQELLYGEKIVFLVSDVYTENNNMHDLASDSLVIVVSASGTFALKSDEWLRSHGGQKILITGNRNTLLQETYDEVYYLSETHITNDRSGIYGKYGLTYLLDLIAEDYFYSKHETQS